MLEHLPNQVDPVRARVDRSTARAKAMLEPGATPKERLEKALELALEEEAEEAKREQEKL